MNDDKKPVEQEMIKHAEELTEPVLVTQDAPTMKYRTIDVNGKQLVVITHNAQGKPLTDKYSSAIYHKTFGIMMIQNANSKGLYELTKAVEGSMSMFYSVSSSTYITIFYDSSIIALNSLFLSKIHADGTYVFGPTFEFNNLHLTIASVAIQVGKKFNVAELESYQDSTYGMIVGTGFSHNQHNDGGNQNNLENGVWMSSRAKSLIKISSEGLVDELLANAQGDDINLRAKQPVEQQTKPAGTAATNIYDLEYKQPVINNYAADQQIAVQHADNLVHTSPVNNAQPDNTAQAHPLVPYTSPIPMTAYAGASLWIAANLVEQAPVLNYACEKIVPFCNATYIKNTLRMPQDDLSWIEIHYALTLSGYVLMASSTLPKEEWNLGYPIAWSVGYNIRLGMFKKLDENQQASMQITEASYNNSLAYYRNVARNCFPAIFIASSISFVSSGPINHLVVGMEPQEIQFRGLSALSTASQSALLCLAHHEKTFNPDKDISTLGKAIPYVADAGIAVLLISNVHSHFNSPFNTLPKIVYGIGQVMYVISGIVATDLITTALVEIAPNGWFTTSSSVHKEDPSMETNTDHDVQKEQLAGETTTSHPEL